MMHRTDDGLMPLLGVWDRCEAEWTSMLDYSGVFQGWKHGGGINDFGKDVAMMTAAVIVRKSMATRMKG
jgi:hypothetical protein